MKYSDLIDVTQAANFLKISKETIYRMIKAKKLPYYKIGKLYKFLPVELMRHFKSGKRWKKL